MNHIDRNSMTTMTQNITPYSNVHNSRITLYIWNQAVKKQLHNISCLLIDLLSGARIVKKYKASHFNFMFVPCIISRSNDQQYTQICTTALFYIPAPTCFGSSLPTSGCFWIRLSYMKIQIDLVVYHIMLVSLLALELGT
jgi:hypothetical protein